MRSAPTRKLRSPKSRRWSSGWRIWSASTIALPPVLRAWVAALIDGPPSDAEIEEVRAWVPLPAEQGR